jgi:5-methylcytosine-specific restriction enzyme subunit McrC
MSFPDVDSINVNNQILSSIKLDRKTAPYERTLELARLIILNYSPDINGGNEKMISILFDMNQLWEEYVLVMLRKAAKSKNELRENPVPKTEIKILGKRRKTFWSSNYIEPDVVLERGNETFIIDTKWKQTGNTSSIQDLRQMYAYARFWKAKECLLLYPGVTSIQKSNIFLTDDYHLLNDNHAKIEHYCKMGFVSVISNNILDKNLGNEILDMFFSEKNARF